MPKLLTKDEAFAILIREAGMPDGTEVELAEALGHVLLQDACADRDLPPFDRSMMDGFAVRAADIATTGAELAVIEEIAAGKLATKPVGADQAIRIMTGAPVPAGADVVVPIELTKSAAPDRVTIMASLAAEKNIARRGTDRTAGEVLIPAGTTLGPAEVGVLAAVGIAHVPVGRKPRMAIMGSGDEVVEPGVTPRPEQIRNSNSYQLLAQAAAHGLNATYLGIAPDDPAHTRRMIEQGLESDIFVSTGGVSVGDKDHVGAAFKELGVEVLFHKVAIKPGKPTTFGRRARTLVFGLPGNPVAALACFHLFVMSAVRARMGCIDPLPRVIRLPLKGRVLPGGDREVFRPARLVLHNGRTCVETPEWHGSGDLAACAGADGFLRQGVGETLEADCPADFYPLPAVL